MNRKTIFALAGTALFCMTALLCACQGTTTEGDQRPTESSPSFSESTVSTPTPTPSKEESTPSKADLCAHEAVIDPAVAPTCTEKGKSEGSHCGKCGQVLEAQKTLSAKGHVIVSDEAIAPTCSKEGKTEGTHCSSCGEVFVWQQPVNMLPHRYKDGVCTVCGTPKASEGLWMELSNDGSYYYVGDLGTCTDKDVVIPSVYGGLPVKEVWYLGGEQVETIVIPDSVTTLHARAFSQNTTLKSVTLGKGITVIESFTFDGCTALEKVTFEGKITEIKKSAFGGTAIKELHVADLASWCRVKFSADAGCPMQYGGVTLYHNGAPVTDLVIPEGVKSISSKAFLNCTSIKSISFPASLTEIGDQAFSGCSALEKLTLPGTVKLVKKGAFSDCTALKEVIVNEGVESFYTYVFKGCTALERIEIGESVKTIGENAFDGFEGQIFFCEAAEQPAGWHKNWMANALAAVYWADSWHYVEGVPTLK